MYINSTGTRTNTWRVNVTRDMFLTSLECNVSVSVLYQEAMVVDLDISRELN
ncbi:hypothetical protein DPMN_084235 [Dreissena polymorpha]|uniref:Uncharacterized protein n=1 Tax=Dreissena polymorpha TaxID=45954 RepID=A0A9D4BJ71_DREPO|nr:hypothetical protein DPMN_084235 [Dreissena polymorpha]